MAKCEDCKYFEKPNPEDGETEEENEYRYEVGECHRFPPSKPPEGNSYGYISPEVFRDYWCGEFESKLKNIPFSLDGFPHGHAANIKRFLWMAERAGTDSEWKERFPDLHPIETMDDFLSLKKEVVLSCPTIGILTWREIHLLQDKIRQKLKL